MSSIWTPGGEHRVNPAPAPAPPAAAPEPPASAGEPTDEELAALQQQLAGTPAAVIVANHCMGLFQLALLHLSLRPPQLPEAALAIDALGALVEGLAGRLGEDEATLRDALAQARMAYVQIKGTAGEA